MTESTRAAGPTSKPGSLRELLAIAVPLVLSSGSLTLMYVIDRAFLSNYSTDALAASLPAGMTHWLLISFAIGTTQYVNSFVAQYEGAGERERVATAIWQGVYFALGAGLLVTACIPVARLIFATVGHGAAIQKLEMEYFSVLCLSGIPALLCAALGSFYSGRGRTLTIMWVNLAGSLINIGLDYLLIFGKFGFPRWGMQGAAAATVMAELSMAGLYIVLLSTSRDARAYQLSRRRPFDRELFGRLLRFGLPAGWQFFSDVFSFWLFIMLVGKMGSDVLAATNVAFNLNTLAFLPMLGFGTAVSTIVGQRIGEGRPALAVISTWKAFAFSATYMVVFAAIYLGLPDLILMPFIDASKPQEFEAIRPLITNLLRFVAVYSLFDAMAIIFGAAIRGAGDTRFAVIFSQIGGIFVLVLPTWLGWKYFGTGVYFAWTMCTLYVSFLGVGFLWRFQQGRWKSMKIIEDRPPVASAVVAPPPETERLPAGTP